MNEDYKQNLKRHLGNKNTWIRGLYMIVFAFACGIVETVGVVLVIYLFVYRLLTGKNHTLVREFGLTISKYIYQIWQYQTFNTEHRPFPFSPWPKTVPAPNLQAEEKQPQAGTKKTDEAKRGDTETTSES